MYAHLPKVSWTGRHILSTRYGWVETNRNFSNIGATTTPQAGDAIYHKQTHLVDRLATTLTTDGRVLPTDTGGVILYAVG